jgi:uncharacterized protein
MTDVTPILQVREVYSHASCPDGTAAAMIVARALADMPERPEIRFVQYGTKEYETLVPGPGHLFVDITPPTSRWEEWIPFRPIVLDHHETAKSCIEGLGGVYGGLELSGGGLAMKHVMAPLIEVGAASMDPDEARGWERLARLASIRDTWKDELPEWREACALAHTMGFVGSKKLVEDSFNKEVDFQSLDKLGSFILPALERKVKLIAESSLIRTAGPPDSPVRIGYFNCTDKSISDVAHYMMEEMGCDMAVGYFMLFQDGSPRFSVSLRSRKGGVDSSIIAKKLGGGGHKPAAGFRHPDGLRGCLLDIALTVEGLLEEAMQ